MVHTAHNAPALEDIADSEKDVWMMGSEGPVGAAVPFAFNFQTQGGHGRSPLTLMEILHDFLPKDADGYSLIGRVSEQGRFEHHPEGMGMFGSVIPMLSAKGHPIHFSPHGVQSFWDASGGRIGKKRRNSKQLMHHGAVSMSPGYSNKVKNLTDRSGVIDGQSHRHSLSEREHEFQNPLLVVGGLSGESSAQSQNARMGHNLFTSMQRMKPAHDPPKSRLTVKDIRSGKHDLSHSSHNINAHTAYHQYEGLKRTGGELSAEERDEIAELEAKQEQLVQDLSFKELTEEEEDEIQNHIEELEQQINDIMMFGGETRSRARGRKRRREYSPHISQMDEKREADLKAIVEMAKRLKPMVEEVDPSAYDTSDPRKFVANMSRLYQDANRALMIMRHEDHGLTTYGYDTDVVTRQSASNLLSTEDEIFNPHREVALALLKNGVELNPDMTGAEILEALGFPKNKKDAYHQEHLEMANSLAEGLMGPVKALKHADLLGTEGRFHPKIDISLHRDTEPHAHNEALEEAFTQHPEYERYINSGRKTVPKAFFGGYQAKLGYLPRLLSEKKKGEENTIAADYGLTHIPSPAIGKVDNKTMTGLRNRTNRSFNDIMLIDSSDMDIGKVAEPQLDGSSEETLASYSHGRPIHPATSTQGHRIGDYFISDTINSAPTTEQIPTVGIEFDGNRQPVVGTQGFPQYFHTVPLDMQHAVFGEDTIKEVLGSKYQQENPNSNYLTPTPSGESLNRDPDTLAMSEDDPLTVLMNPDLLFKASEKPLPVLPMHRIFKVSDLDSLRGFSGEWAVSALPSGERMIVERKSGRVKAYDQNGAVTLSDEDRKQFRSVSEKNYIVDVLRHDDEMLIVDILDYDDTNISDMNLRERIKVLRGQFDSHEHVIVPGPHNFRLTDEEGLEKTVSTLQEDHERLLLRDATSTYMKGEPRHPKWFLLRSNKEVALKILDVRGKGPFTYRLGAGPVDADNLGNRGVEHEGKHYLDVGTVQSPKPFNEGDVINVSVSGVKQRKKNERVLFDVTASKIVGEANDDSPVSTESLSLLTKSYDLIAVPFDLALKSDSVTVQLRGIDDVTYTLEKSTHGYWAHSPRSSLGELSDSTYAVELAESLAPLWKPATSLMMKGAVRSMSKPKHRKLSENQSAGVIQEDDESNILKPTRQEVMVKTLSRIVDLYERIEKEKMSGTTGARGLGIDVGSQIESPRGPTSLTSEQSMPDWDMRDRPSEDPEEEYPVARLRRMKEKNKEQYADYEAESEND